jgi:hypothetical protein
MTPRVLALLVAVALMAVGCGDGVVYVTPSPAPDTPVLTEEAAVGLVSSTCRNPGVAHLIRSKAHAVYQGKGIWAVQYGSTRWQVYDATGLVAPIGRGAFHITCQREPSE